MSGVVSEAKTLFQVILEGEHYHGHIQELKDNTAIVFIQELGEKSVSHCVWDYTHEVLYKIVQLQKNWQKVTFGLVSHL